MNDNVRKPRTKLPPPPFPGPWPLRKVRHIAFMVWFTRILKKLMDDKMGIQHDFIEVGELKTPAPGQKAPLAKAAPKAAAPAKKSVQIVEDDDGYYDDGYDDGYYDDDYYDDDYYSPRPPPPPRAPPPRSRNTIGGIARAMGWPRGNRGAPPPAPPRRAPRVVVDTYDQDYAYNEPVSGRAAKTLAAPVYRPPPGSITGRSVASRIVVDDDGATYGSDPRRRKPPIITPAPAENVYTQNRNNNYPPEKRVGEYTEYVDDRRGLLPNASVSESFLTGIQLKECVSALHNIYTNPNGRMANILQRATSDAANDFKLALLENKGAQREAIYKDLDFIIEKLTFEITEIMPKTGVLGTHKKAFAYSLVQPGRTFPSTYFWSVEKRLLNLDRSGRTVTCTDFHALVLLSGIYIGRALVSTCFFRPMEYGLTDSQPTARVESNLRILSSIFMYIWRKVLSDQYAVNPVEIPLEIGKFVFNDEIMAPMYERLKNNIIYAENLIREWGKEYIRRLRTAK